MDQMGRLLDEYLKQNEEYQKRKKQYRDLYDEIEKCLDDGAKASSLLAELMYHNSIDITTYEGYILQIDCNKAEDGLKTTAWTDHVLNAMAIDNPLEYAGLYLNNEMQIFINPEDSREL